MNNQQIFKCFGRRLFPITVLRVIRIQAAGDLQPKPSLSEKLGKIADSGWKELCGYKFKEIALEAKQLEDKLKGVDT